MIKIDEDALAEFFAKAGHQIARGHERQEWSSGGIDVTAAIERDEDTRPTDFECYSADDVARWRRDEWWYVNLDLTVRVGGPNGVSATASLGGIDHLIGEETAEAVHMTVTLGDLWADVLAELPEAARTALAEASAKVAAANRVLAA